MHKLVFGTIIFLAFFFISFLGSIGDVNAHSGGLNASGCHGGSRPYHCHRRSSEMVRTVDGKNRLRCDLGSRSKECVSSNTLPRQVNVLNLQIQLRRHCSGLSVDFTDGKMGPETKRTLTAFQAAYGLQPDGILGANTNRALSRAPNGQCRISR